MKKAFPCLTFLIFCFSSLYSQSAEPRPYQLLWEVLAPKTNSTAVAPKPSYLFGTMHVTDARAFNMPDSVLLGIQNTTGFALEVDFDSASYLFLEYLYAAKGAAIFDKSTWENGSLNASKWDSKPRTNLDPTDIFKVFERESGRRDEATFLDAFLYRLARAQGKTICGLEGIVSQLQLIANPVPDAPAPSDTIQKPSPRVKRPRLNELIAIYEKGDLQAVNDLVNEGGGTTNFFKKEVIIKRNYGMAARADSLMQIRPTFIGVGAAHLPGDEGMIALLRQRGYRLRPVAVTYTGMAKQALDQEYVPKWTSFQRARDGYRLLVPARPFAVDILEGKAKMYVGMDFPGGLVYCFYALQLPGEISAEKMESISTSMAKSMGKAHLETDESANIVYQGLKGKEFRIKRGDDQMRIRLLYSKRKLFLLLMGNSPLVTESQAANDWFNSLTFFDPLAITRQARVSLRDEINGFSMQMPSDYDYETHQIGGFAQGSDEPLYNKYEIEDGQHAQVLRVLIQDFQTAGASGELGDRLAKGVYFMTKQDLEPFAAPDSLLVDGVHGLGATYTFSGLRYRIECYLQHNRMYLVGMGLAEDDPDSLAVSEIMRSIHFLPRKAAPLTYQLVKSGLFDASLPSKPAEWDVETLPEAYSGRIDSLHVFYCHDPVSSFNASIELAHVWPYFAGDNAELMQAVCKVKGYGAGDTLPLWFKKPAWESKPVTPFARYYRHAQKDLQAHIFIIPTNDYLIIGKIQAPNNEEGDAISLQFARSLHAFAPSTKDLQRKPRFADIVEALDSASSELPTALELSWTDYRLQPSEYDAAANTCLQQDDNRYSSWGHTIFYMLMQVEDSAILPRLQQLYLELPKSSTRRIVLLSHLLNQPWSGAADWATAQLRQDPSALDYQQFDSDPFHEYLSHDDTGARMQSLAFLLDQPDHALQLAAAAADIYEAFGWDYRAYDLRFSLILRAAIQQNLESLEDAAPEEQMLSLFTYLADTDSPDWQAHARQLLCLPEGYLPGVVLQRVLENGIRPLKRELSHVMSLRESRDYALSYMLEAGIADMLPGKYRRPDFIAEVSLDLGLEGYPSQVALVEKRQIIWAKQDQYLYIFRFAFDGERDWTLGFAGPIPEDGLPQNAGFELSGSNYDLYSPNTYKKLTQKWLRSAADED